MNKLGTTTHHGKLVGLINMQGEKYAFYDKNGIITFIPR